MGYDRMLITFPFSVYELDEEAKRKATITVCSWAKDSKEAKEILSILGLV